MSYKKFDEADLKFLRDLCGVERKTEPFRNHRRSGMRQ